METFCCDFNYNQQLYSIYGASLYMLCSNSVSSFPDAGTQVKSNWLIWYIKIDYYQRTDWIENGDSLLEQRPGSMPDASSNLKFPLCSVFAVLIAGYLDLNLVNEAAWI